MIMYEDDAVVLDDSGVTIKHYHRPGRPRHISYADVMSAELISLGFATGRYQLIGFSPGRPRHFFHWDHKRSTKRRGVSLDIGRWRRLAITPDDPDVVIGFIQDRSGATRREHS